MTQRALGQRLRLGPQPREHFRDRVVRRGQELFGLGAGAESMPRWLLRLKLLPSSTTSTSGTSSPLTMANTSGTPHTSVASLIRSDTSLRPESGFGGPIGIPVKVNVDSAWEAERHSGPKVNSIRTTRLGAPELPGLFTALGATGVRDRVCPNQTRWWGVDWVEYG